VLFTVPGTTVGGVDVAPPDEVPSAPVPNGNCPVPDEFGVVDAPELSPKNPVVDFLLPPIGTDPLPYLSARSCAAAANQSATNRVGASPVAVTAAVL